MDPTVIRASAEPIIFIVLAAIWVVVQILNRAGKSAPRPKAPGERPEAPPGRSETPDRPVARPSASPEDELRRFLQELTGAPAEEPRPAAPPPPPPPPPPMPRAPTSRPARAATRPPPAPSRRAAAPRRAAPHPFASVSTEALRAEEKRMTRAAARGLSDTMRQAMQRRAGSATVGAAALKLGMPAMPMLPPGAGAAFRATPGRAARHNRVPRGEPDALRRAVVLSTVLAAPRALAPPGSDRPYED